jgi:integration host factor subunit beta
MIRSALVDRIHALNPHLRRVEVEELITVLFDEITAALARGGRVEIRGFGAFSVRSREPRTGRNPRTGEVVSVKKKASPRFKAAKKLNERLNSDDS